ncbi:MAG: low molecular weight protein arginine phosphatase [Bacillota bacterium]|uniref:low molecular weight protein arginine phosphatase n=1 Tax=Desulforudis sp. DRI-14 TaxID=3459793 RepID=UPI00348E8FDD
MARPKKILFVCTGNTCRSSMAEGIARHLLGDDREIRVLSAGVHALPNVPATPEAVEALAEEGIDISGHRAALLTRELVEEADLVLTMTAGHRRLVREAAPDQAGKVFTLAEYAGAGGDVSDPLGQPLHVYRRYAAELRRLIRLALERFREEAGRVEGNRSSAVEDGKS